MQQLPIAVAAAIAGWLLGWISASATEWLQRQDELPSAAVGPFVRDPIVQVSCAALWALAALVLETPQWIAAGMIAVPLVQVAITDLRHRYVYTWVAVVGVGLGVALSWQVHPGQEWVQSAVDSVKGAVGGLVAFLLMYLIGIALSRVFFGGLEPLARGDITIAAMVGASAGACTVSALFLGVLASGLIAAGVLFVRRRTRVYFAYGPGLCLGGLIMLFRC